VELDAEYRPLVSETVASLRSTPSEIPKACRNQPSPSALSLRTQDEEETMGRGILLWLLGVPIPVIILLWLFFGR
jgi:hypothetical protein